MTARQAARGPFSLHLWCPQPSCGRSAGRLLHNASARAHVSTPTLLCPQCLQAPLASLPPGVGSSESTWPKGPDGGWALGV